MSAGTGVGAPTGRGRGRGRLLRLGAFGAAAAATVGLTQVPVSGAFNGITGNAANTASSAANFCTATSTTLVSTGDSWTDEAAANYIGQNDTEIRVRSSTSGRRYVWTGFALPTVPAHCDLVGAQLSYYNKAPSSGRNIDVYRGVTGGTPWTAATLTWANQPGHTGTAATNAATTSTPGWQRWDVTAHVRAQYSGGNNGLVLLDRVVNASPGAEQVYYDRQHTTYTPTLVLTWG
jgi:hypothetical protein